MGTTAAERQRRSRAHRKGDHQFCDPARCDGQPAVTDTASDAQPVTEPAPEPVTPAPAEPDEAEPAEYEPGETERDVSDFIKDLEFPEGDPRRILCRIAVKAARRVDQVDLSAREATSAIRQMMTILGQLAEIPDQPAGPLDGVRARAAVRRIGTATRRAR